MNDNFKKGQTLSGEYVKDYYNKALNEIDAPYADFRWFSSVFSRVEYNQTKKTILKAIGDKKFDSVLEVGGGDGAWTEILIPISEHITEIDISNEMLKRARERFKKIENIDFINRDFLENELVSEAYDFIYAIRSFEYFPDKEKAVGEMKRLLRSGGEALIVTKNPYYISFNKSKGKKLLHIGQIGASEFERLLKEAGFLILENRPAILGKKFDWFPVRYISNLLHSISNSSVSWFVPGIFKKYFSESYLILAKKI